MDYIHQRKKNTRFGWYLIYKMYKSNIVYSKINLVNHTNKLNRMLQYNTYINRIKRTKSTK